MLLENLDLNDIQDIEPARRAIIMLFNLLEDLKADNRKLQEENQRLRDENNRLKGEQGKPDIKPNKPQGESAKSDHSSEAERRKPQERQKSHKLENIQIDRQQVLTVDPAKLPPDAELKGYEEVVVQDILIRTDNILFRKEKYYSPTERKTYPSASSGQAWPSCLQATRGGSGRGLNRWPLCSILPATCPSPRSWSFSPTLGFRSRPESSPIGWSKGSRPCMERRTPFTEPACEVTPGTICLS